MASTEETFGPSGEQQAVVEAALAALGGSPDEVYRSLLAAGVTGRPSPWRCPVALHLRSLVSGPLLVDYHRVLFEGGRVPLPRPVARFVELFDGGRYLPLRDDL